MDKKKTKLEIAGEKTQVAIDHTNLKIKELGENTVVLYDNLTDIQKRFDLIRNVPSDKKIEYEKLKEIRLSWKEQAEKIEKDNKTAVAKNAGAGAAGIGAAFAVAFLGSTAAMKIAKTFGVASTGTPISSLRGAAATNAKLAWLGGGALNAGGGGMDAGNLFRKLAPVVSSAIFAGVSLIGSGLLLIKSLNEKKRLEDIFTLISERDIKNYQLAIVELEERIQRIKNESNLLIQAIEKIEAFGIDYLAMTEAQQYELGAYVNLMSSSTQLLVNPILGLQPKYSTEDFKSFTLWEDRKANLAECLIFKNVIISLSNLLYKIEIEEKDKKLLWKSFKGNKKLLESFNLKKKDFSFSIMEAVFEALNHKYSLSSDV